MSRSVWTPEIAATIERTMREGIGFERAARIAGIGVETLRNWRKKGEADPDGQYGTLAMACARAEASMVGRAEKCINEAIKEDKDVKAAMWLLSKKLPAEYGEKLVVQSGDDVSELPMDDQTKDAVVNALRMIRGGKKTGEQK